LRFGSTLLAAKLAGRRFFGIELDPSIAPSRAGASSPEPLERRGFSFLFLPFFAFFAGCPVMRPEKEKLHKRGCLRAVFQRFSRAPDSRIPARERK
jgi:hypothetical protein